MREILFRAKTLGDDGYWIEGYYIHRGSLRLSSNAEGGVYTKYSDWIYTGDEDDGEKIRIDTLCQYTGMLDSWGNKIFEGDIILVDDERGIVVWDEDSLAFMIDVDNVLSPLGEYFSRQIEICSNVHDAKEVE